MIDLPIIYQIKPENQPDYKRLTDKRIKCHKANIKFYDKKSYGQLKKKVV